MRTDRVGLIPVVQRRESGSRNLETPISGLRLPERSPESVSAHVAATSGCLRPGFRHVGKVLSRKWRPPFFLRSGAKNVGRHKSSQGKGLCLIIPAGNRKKMRFCPSKYRHFSPFLGPSRTSLHAHFTEKMSVDRKFVGSPGTRRALRHKT